jgi:UDP-glucose 4-epimerase
MNLLVSGGLGYIGSHTCVELIEAGHSLVIVDDFSNSEVSVLNRVSKLSGATPTFYPLSIHSEPALEEIFLSHKIDTVIHFAGFKSVTESLVNPISYYYNNTAGSISLLNVMAKVGVKSIIFSSSATVYGDSEIQPVKEIDAPSPNNPYGTSKLAIEKVLQDLVKLDNGWRASALRYFNPVGAHPSGLIGEPLNDNATNLMPILGNVVSGKIKKLSIFGGDYPTRDGTGVRDFIHVMDLASGHLAALNHLSSNKGFHVFNLGTGNGTTVLELVEAYQSASGQQIDYEICDRRIADIAISYADVSKAKKQLNWQAKYDIGDMCRDAWNWHSKMLAG